RFGDGPCLAAFFRADTRVGGGSVNQTYHRHAEFLCLAHEPLRFAVALRMGHAEVVHRARHRVGALFLADHHDASTAETRRSPDHRAVLSKESIAADFRPVVERDGYHLERPRSFRMARQLDGCKRSLFAVGGLGAGAHTGRVKRPSSVAMVSRRLRRSTTASSIPWASRNSDV